MLPSPKGTPLSNKSFIPNVLTRKVFKSPQSKKLPSMPKLMAKDNLPSDDDEDLKDVPETFDEKIWQEVCAPKKSTPKRTIAEVSVEPEAIVVPGIVLAPEIRKPYDGLDNAAVSTIFEVKCYDTIV